MGYMFDKFSNLNILDVSNFNPKIIKINNLNMNNFNKKNN